jgi:hypothetical protein
VRRNKYILIDFPIKALTKKEAAVIAKWTPRVKHHHKDYLRGIREVDHNEYLKQISINKNDLYLKAKNSSEQNNSAIYDRLIDEI